MKFCLKTEDSKLYLSTELSLCPLSEGAPKIFDTPDEAYHCPMRGEHDLVIDVAPEPANAAA